MAKFGINDILNAKTKAAGQQAQTEGYKEIYLSPYEVKAAQENTHQKLENIEELADSFLHVGQEQPTVLARVNGEYRIIDGHRRNAANILNLERGHKEYEKVLYRFMDMSEAMYFLNVALKHNMETRKFRPIKIEQRAHIDGFVSVIDAMTVRQKYWEECGELLKNAA